MANKYDNDTGFASPAEPPTEGDQSKIPDNLAGDGEVDEADKKPSEQTTAGERGISMIKGSKGNIPVNQVNVKKLLLPVGSNMALDWVVDVKDSKGNITGQKINVSKLAKYIRQNTAYVFTLDESTRAVIRYWFTKGVYTYCSDNDVKLLINDHIPDGLDNPDITQKTMKQVYERRDGEKNPFVKMEEINNCGRYRIMENGVLDFDTMQIEDFGPKHLQTIKLNCPFPAGTPVSKNGAWDAFMDYITCGNKAERQLLEEFMGVILSPIPARDLKCAIIMEGETDTGKTQLRDFIELILGKSNCSSLELRNLDERFDASSLVNKRLSGSKDMKYASIDDMGTFKQIVGGGGISVEPKHEKRFEAEPNLFFWFIRNPDKELRMPLDKATAGRLIYYKMLCPPVPKDQQDDKLLDKFIEDKEYIVWTLLQRAKVIYDMTTNGQKRQFTMPERTLEEREKELIRLNSVRAFVDKLTRARNTIEEEGKICYTGPVPKIGMRTSGDVSAANMYRAYERFCLKNNIKAVTPEKFKLELREIKVMENKTLDDGTVAVVQAMDDDGNPRTYATQKKSGVLYYYEFCLTDEAIVLYTDDGAREESLAKQAEVGLAKTQEQKKQHENYKRNAPKGIRVSYEDYLNMSKEQKANAAKMKAKSAKMAAERALARVAELEAEAEAILLDDDSKQQRGGSGDE